MRWAIDNPTRLTRIVDARGHTQVARDKTTLRDEIIAILEVGHQPKTVLVRALHTSMTLVDTALSELERQGRVEKFRMMSERKRLDIFWCVSGAVPTPIAANSGFSAAETLAAFQEIAMQRARKQ
ncbi:hypothetical protein [Caballeronia sp. dw_19]|uniref:hypothetical protein n=1 Tax=Caballeronia sp. dw_19 TaxID=2719791 RepID=UPI001BD5C92E|nr:hypothetical protein [Caballeronia sp. dw_19]